MHRPGVEPGTSTVKSRVLCQPRRLCVGAPTSTFGRASELNVLGSETSGGDADVSVSYHSRNVVVALHAFQALLDVPGHSNGRVLLYQSDIKATEPSRRMRMTSTVLK